MVESMAWGGCWVCAAEIGLGWWVCAGFGPLPRLTTGGGGGGEWKGAVGYTGIVGGK